DKPLLGSVTQWLLADFNQGHLANTLVVVPTSNSGRRLRLELSKNGGVLSPHVITPNQLFEVDGVATRHESLWAWVDVIRGIDVNAFPHLLPNHQAEAVSRFSAALAISRQLMLLREMLADGDASFKDAQFHSPEKERWQELVSLESDMLQCLRKWGLRDTVLAKRNKAKSPDIPVGVDRVVVACVPDPTLLALRGLQSLCHGGLPVTVLVHAPADEKDSFDAWGIPHLEHWTSRQVDIPDWGQRMHVCDSSTEVAQQCLKVLASEQARSDDTVLALCDPTFSTALEKSFSQQSWPLFNPDGAGVADTGFATTLRAVKNLMGAGPPFGALMELVRQPSGKVFLPDHIERFQAAESLDKLHQDHLPETLADALSHASGVAKAILELAVSKLGEVNTGSVSKILRIWLTEMLAEAGGEVAPAVEPVLAESIEAIEKLENWGESPTAQEAIEMMLEGIRSTKVTDDRADTVIDLQGWLEIPYDPASHLVLLGMHDECVPGGVADDLFIPDSLRKKLGLRDSRDRFARDAYLLHSAIAPRRENGRVDVFVARFNDAGEARKPSRLLMRQRGKELAMVVNHLFAESDSNKARGGAWIRDWQLQLPDCPNPYSGDDPHSLSPSAIRDYLDCPFRFYLKRLLNMRVYEPDKREMDAMDFGNICHRVVDAFAKNDGIRDSTDEAEISAFFDDSLEIQMQRSYGDDLSLPLMVQMESARERLRALAAIQAERAAQGWHIVQSEYRVGGENVPWLIDGQPVKMTIDRIDRHDDGNQWCVWDYKTSGKAKHPQDAHQVTWREDENRLLLGELIPAKGRKKERRWADVQLPLYAAFIQQHFKTDELPQVGYINLPRAVSDVEFCWWKDFDQATSDHAMDWTVAAIHHIRSGLFHQPAIFPASRNDYDDFYQLAPDGLASAFGL
ncbi:MAG: PD-(D/E)XK nuclease family protein, partial [Verrucomicrobiae bacterium]|nr:PD-(D/E)XK nuclease family protein [Verrucomicrobiae bacterium]NNJ86324.1 hypothetical protein [Akkermansiaceae bacterium]